LTKLVAEPLRHAVGRSQRYWISDGIPEIVMGGFWVIWGLVVLLPPLFSRTPGPLMPVLIIVAMSAAGLLMKPLIYGWKERATFPRTGYIELRQPDRHVRYGIPILVFAIALAVGVFSRFEERSLREWVPLGLGLLLAATLLQASWKIHSLRLAIFSIAVAGVAIIASVLQMPRAQSIAVTLLTAGLSCVADGVLVLRAYLRAHPIRSEDAQ
jgi:hypothetical protein